MKTPRIVVQCLKVSKMDIDFNDAQALLASMRSRYSAFSNAEKKSDDGIKLVNEIKNLSDAMCNFRAEHTEKNEAGQ